MEKFQFSMVDFGASKTILAAPALSKARVQ